MQQTQRASLEELPDLICSLQGSILVTAPHSITLPPLHRKTHYRERGTGHLAIAIAQRLCSTGQHCSLMVWNCAARADDSRLDPNYLPTANLVESEWHRSIHAWVLRASKLECPLLHIDLHGKITDELFLDVGIAALEHIWPQKFQFIVTMLKCQFAKALDEVLGRFHVRGALGALITTKIDPRLDGYRDNGFATTSMQTALLGVPSVQLEFPSLLRNRLLSEKELRDALADAIAKVYRDSLVPLWPCMRFGSDVPVVPVIREAGNVLRQEDAAQGSSMTSSPNAGEETDAVCAVPEAYSVIDEAFQMLGGMVLVPTAPDYGQECNDQDAPAIHFLSPCDFGPIRESGPVAQNEFSDWCTSLMLQFRRWEESCTDLQSI